MKNIAYFNLIWVLLMQGCSIRCDDVEVEPMNVCDICQTWVLEATKTAENQPWQSLSGVCWDDDLHTFSADHTYKVDPGPIIGECSGCASCYVNGSWQKTDSLLITQRSDQQPDSFKVIYLDANYFIRETWNDDYYYLQKFRKK